MLNANIIKRRINRLSLADIEKLNSMPADPAFSSDKAVQEMRDLVTKKDRTNITNEQAPNFFKVFSTFEFEKGMLLTECFPTIYQSFAIDLNRKFQKEFDCQTPSEKSLAELAVINFCRTLYIQKKINDYIKLGTFTDIGVGYLNFLSKELDRANRHYLTALQSIKAIKQPNIQVNVKTQTAVIGQNQVIQNKNT